MLTSPGSIKRLFSSGPNGYRVREAFAFTQVAAQLLRSEPVAKTIRFWMDATTTWRNAPLLARHATQSIVAQVVRSS